MGILLLYTAVCQQSIEFLKNCLSIQNSPTFCIYIINARVAIPIPYWYTPLCKRMMMEKKQQNDKKSSGVCLIVFPSIFSCLFIIIIIIIYFSLHYPRSGADSTLSYYYYYSFPSLSDDTTHCISSQCEGKGDIHIHLVCFFLVCTK